jgi:DNA-directed DNA polymerase III PolC
MYLNTHSYFSLRYGTIKPKTLLEMAQENGLKQLVLTDINNTSACMDFVRLAPKYGVKPILGVDFRHGAEQHFILIARSNQGFYHINTYLSQLLQQKNFALPANAKQLADTFVIYPYANNQHRLKLKENEYLGVTIQDLNQLRYSGWYHRQDKLLILHTVSFQNKTGFNTHRLLRAIDNNTLLSKLLAKEQGQEWQQMLPPEELIAHYRDFPALVANTQRLLDACHLAFDFAEPQNQRTYSGNQTLDFKLLHKLSYDGLAYRYPNPGEKVYNRIEQELDIIRQKDFVAYFLINWKILKYARSKNYYYVGRGSGTNSIIAYLLRITDVDPIELDLYFERFINLYRKNAPDFDIDFSWTDRDDITSFIFQRFKHTALVGVYNTFQYKASIRELGKVMGLPKHEIDKLTKGRFNYSQLDHLSQLVVVYAKQIQDFPNYLGIHAGGILISERPVQYHCATFMPPKGFPTTQIDMVVAEDIGLYKFDILSQRGLGKIKDTVAIVRENTGEEIDIHDFKRFKEDEKVKHLLRNAKAIGCFYVESPAMRMLLKKLQVDDYLGLVAASSIIRPGVAKSGMMREYILRFRHPEKRQDAHPTMLAIMPETFGVMVYQEDVIKVAHYFGGLTLGEADMLRRGMSGKFRSRDEFMKVRDKFFTNCKEKGRTIQLTTEIWRQIESFAGYAFAKGHSASYAVESYQSLFLKAYHPLEYMVATINNSGGFYSRELYVHEARMHGGIIKVPCINHSRLETSIKGAVIYLGFHVLKSLAHKLSLAIVREREANGRFQSLDDFISRVSIGLEQIIILIKVNAFSTTGKNKRELLWEAHMKINACLPTRQGISFVEHSPYLFRQEQTDFSLPKLVSSANENSFDELEHIGFTLGSPFSLLKNQHKNSLTAASLPARIGQYVCIDGYLITVKNTSTTSGKRMCFGTFIDQNGDFIDTVHFPPIAAKFPFRGPGVYQIKGKVMEEFQSISIEVTEMLRLPMIEDPRYAA